MSHKESFFLKIFQSSGEAQEVMSLRQGPVRLVRFLVNPSPGLFDSYSVLFHLLLPYVNKLVKLNNV